MRSSNSPSVGVLNTGDAAWAFEDFANYLADVLWVDVVKQPVEYNYVLAWPGSDLGPSSFIPFRSIALASDKRLQMKPFELHNVPTPTSVLLRSRSAVEKHLSDHRDATWVLKYPIGTGGSGHRIINNGDAIPPNWPTPYLLQRFVECIPPCVYRLYCVNGEIFGWNVRRFPSGQKSPSPWVSHTNGAAYYDLKSSPPKAALLAAELAFNAAGLLDCFGCVDLIPESGTWLVLEVGTDGLGHYVDRDVGGTLQTQIGSRLASAFWKAIDTPPWHPDPWRIRQTGSHGL
jgi:hypothetical protein